jgi:hypothetical protein
MNDLNYADKPMSKTRFYREAFPCLGTMSWAITASAH